MEAKHLFQTLAIAALVDGAIGFEEKTLLDRHASAPSYNYARFVGRAVESCLAQTFADMEVVVVDDGSTDESPALLAERFSRNPRVRLELAKENKGISANFNRGLRAASGRLVGF